MFSQLDTPSASIVEAFAAVARPIIRGEYDIDSCIASTSIAVGVLRHFGLQVMPMVARMRAFNPAMGQCLREAGPLDAHAFERWNCDQGARMVSIGYADGRGVSEGYWAGHLVALVERQLLVDASADQASRPNDSIYLPGVLVAPITPMFRAGLERLLLRTGDKGGVVYEPYPADRSFRAAPHWKGSPTSKFVTNAIIVAMGKSRDIAVAA